MLYSHLFVSMGMMIASGAAQATMNSCDRCLTSPLDQLDEATRMECALSLAVENCNAEDYPGYPISYSPVAPSTVTVTPSWCSATLPPMASDTTVYGPGYSVSTKIPTSLPSTYTAALGSSRTMSASALLPTKTYGVLTLSRTTTLNTAYPSASYPGKTLDAQPTSRLTNDALGNIPIHHKVVAAGALILVLA